MKKIIQTFVAMAVIASMTGCATPYMTDRRLDAADIFTITGGIGAGAKARVGPIHLSLFANRDLGGLRSGVFFTNPDISRDWCTLIPLGINTGHGRSFVTGMEDFDLDSDASEFDEREKGVSSVAVPGLSIPSIWKAHFYTGIEMAVGLGPTVRLGFNPGELLDFILGWTTFDIYGDDLEAKKQEEKSNQSSEATPKSAPQ